VARARAGAGASAIAALSRFLEAYPSSPRAGEAAAMLGWLLVDTGDLAGAERRFRAAENDPVDAVRASARKGLRAIASRH
jgi:TolA-binding protein